MKLIDLAGVLLVEEFITNEQFYHVGPEFEKFSMQGFGRGENNHLLGHGMYFINSEYIAKGYAKYSTDPVLYTVTFNASPQQFYNNRLRPTSEQDQAYINIAKELGFNTYKEMPYNHSAMKYGRGLPGAVFEKLGTKAGNALLVKYGVVGQCEDIGDGVYEVAVYDLSIIQIQSKTKLPSNAQESPNTDWDWLDNKPS